MLIDFHSARDTWEALIHPGQAFRDREARGRSMATAVLSMLAWRLPFTLASWLLGLGAYRLLRQTLLEGTWHLSGPQRLFHFDPEALRTVALELPALPGFWSLLPWLIPLAALVQLGVWMHHTVWDHLALWLLGGLRRPEPWHRSALAQAEALQVGAIGLALGLLSHIPLLGCVLALPLMLAGLWFWVLRGLALAAWHQCPTWKGVVATLLHIPLVMAFYGFLALGVILIAGVLAL